MCITPLLPPFLTYQMGVKTIFFNRFAFLFSSPSSFTDGLFWKYYIVFMICFSLFIWTYNRNLCLMYTQLCFLPLTIQMLHCCIDMKDQCSLNTVWWKSEARNPYARMRMRVRIRQISKSKDKQGGYPYIRMRVRLRMIFKYD